MTIIFFIILTIMSALVAASLFSAFKPSPDASKSKKAITLGAIAFFIILIWIAYFTLGNPQMVER